MEPDSDALFEKNVLNLNFKIKVRPWQKKAKIGKKKMCFCLFFLVLFCLFFDVLVLSRNTCDQIDTMVKSKKYVSYCGWPKSGAGVSTLERGVLGKPAVTPYQCWFSACPVVQDFVHAY